MKLSTIRRMAIVVAAVVVIPACGGGGGGGGGGPTSGGLDPAFGSGGAISENPSLSSERINEIAVDGSFMYVVGFDMSPGTTMWRIEKRSLSTGALDPAFNGDGVVFVAPAGGGTATAIAIDASFMYVVGGDASPGNGQWRIEKRNLSDGALAASATNNPSTGGDAPTSIAIDATHMYVFGKEGSSTWRIEKRSLSTLALETTTFGGATGFVTFAAGSPNEAHAVAVGGGFIYTAGEVPSAPNTQWRIEKRSASTGLLVGGFGTAGAVLVDPTTGFEGARDLAIDSSYLYAVGTGGNTDWRIEKRLLSDGSPVSGFGTGGVVTSDPLPLSGEFPNGIAIDGVFMYVTGIDSVPGDQEWRVEKRNLSDGALDPGFGSGGVVTSDPNPAEVDQATDIAVDGSFIYIVGMDEIQGVSDEEWRIEKRLK